MTYFDMTEEEIAEFEREYDEWVAQLGDEIETLPENFHIMWSDVVAEDEEFDEELFHSH